MAFKIAEDWKGRVRNNADMRREYILVWDGEGDSDDTTAATELYAWLSDQANIPGIDLLNYPQNDIGVNEVNGVDPITFKGFGSWASLTNSAAGTVKPPSPKDVDQITFTFTNQAEGGNIQSSLNTPYKIFIADGLEFEDPSGLTLPKGFNGLINCEGEGSEFKFKGVDLQPPPSAFDINWVTPNSYLSYPVILDLMKWVGTTNQAPFTLFGNQFKKQELFYSGISGTRRTNEDWELSLAFAYSRDRGGNDWEENPNGPWDQTDWVKVMGGKFKVPMHGFDYVWIYNLPAWNDTDKEFNKPAKNAAVYVEKVWEDHDWTTTQLNNLQSLTIIDQPDYP